jgi:hypothetical protein
MISPAKEARDADILARVVVAVFRWFGCFTPAPPRIKRRT